MTLQYTLINGATQPFSSFNIIVPPKPDGPTPLPNIGANQTFQFSVKGNSGQTVSATAQVWVSTDGKTFVQYGSPITVTGTTSAAAGFAGNQAWPFYSATLTTISGLGAAATLVMSGAGD